MKLFFKKYKKIIAFVLFILFIGFLFFINKKGSLSPLSPRPTLTPLIFDLKGIIPSYGIGAKIIETSAIEFKFNKPINVDTLSIKVEPETEIKFETDQNNRLLFIRAVPWWEVGQLYNMTIDVKSEDGENLSKKIEYQLQIEQMTESGLTEQFFSTPLSE